LRRVEIWVELNRLEEKTPALRHLVASCEKHGVVANDIGAIGSQRHGFLECDAALVHSGATLENAGKALPGIGIVRLLSDCRAVESLGIVVAELVAGEIGKVAQRGCKRGVSLQRCSVDRLGLSRMAGCA